jgi:hypothetical protein
MGRACKVKTPKQEISDVIHWADKQGFFKVAAALRRDLAEMFLKSLGLTVKDLETEPTLTTLRGSRATRNEIRLSDRAKQPRSGQLRVRLDRAQVIRLMNLTIERLRV